MEATDGEDISSVHNVSFLLQLGWRLDISSVHNVSFLLLSVTAEILKSIIVNLLESEQIFASVKQRIEKNRRNSRCKTYYNTREHR